MQQQQQQQPQQQQLLLQLLLLLAVVAIARRRVVRRDIAASLSPVSPARLGRVAHATRKPTAQRATTRLDVDR
jgi:hypothetical protein